MFRHKFIQPLFVSLLTGLSIYSYVQGAFNPIIWLLLLLWLGLTIWGSFDIRLGYFIKTICRQSQTREREISITFDDGPTSFTPAVLDLLAAHNLKATFFCIGSQIEKYPAIFTRILQEGHHFGNHTYTHPKNFGFLNTAEVEAEIAKTNEIILKTSGKSPLWFRPPFGVTNPSIAKALSRTRHTVIGWNIRSLDTVTEDETKILQRIESRLNPGGIILLHDTTQKTVRVLEQLLLTLDAKDYKVVPLDQLLNIPVYED